MKNRQTIKKIPYGTTDFKLIVQDNYYYTDKTRFIEVVEVAPRYLFFIRPRRFGKSLWLSILQYYYDIAYKDDFEAIFKGTYIGANPTSERSKYLILSFNFAMIDAKIGNTEASFEHHCNLSYVSFVNRYQAYFTQTQLNELAKETSSSAKLNTLLQFSQDNRLKIYILIDEYDNFTNSILARYGMDSYKTLVGEQGFFKHFFNVIKGGATGTDAVITNFFITGVSPITLDDVTSGGIGFNITSQAAFNELVGFTEKEVIDILTYYHEKSILKTEVSTILQFMQKWYGGYTFSKKAKQTLFNSTMVFSFITNYQLSEGFPDKVLDANTRVEYAKLKHLLILDKKLNGNFSVLKEIIENNSITAKLQDFFSVDRLTVRDNFVSLLYYFGLITSYKQELGKQVFEIPNQAIKDFFTNYIKEGYEDAGIFRLPIYEYSNLVSKMAYKGEWKAVFLFLSEAIKAQSRVRDYLQGESMIKGFLLAYLNITDDFIITSEKELNKGYADLWLAPMVTTVAHPNFSYLIEIKYNKKSNAAEMEKQLPSLTASAKEQLTQYAQDAIIQKEKETTTLKKIVLVYNAWELVYTEEIV